ncbi:MAG: ANTAR domain-containing protein [Nakamurella sp.]
MTADQSFGTLRRYSQDQNVKLRSIAAHLVTTRQLLTP